MGKDGNCTTCSFLRTQLARKEEQLGLARSALRSIANRLENEREERRGVLSKVNQWILNMALGALDMR
jgi:hypothetical protein